MTPAVLVGFFFGGCVGLFFARWMDAIASGTDHEPWLVALSVSAAAWIVLALAI